jgi:SAM-dependent methyltransferase
MTGPKLLNVGCGSKFHPGWTNIDMAPASKQVQRHDVSRGLPFPAGTFDVVYHSQVLEHVPRADAPQFLRECLRVLKPGGLMRVVVPDLEGIAREYLRLLESNLVAPTQQSRRDYEWILLELLDQSVRQSTGGRMEQHIRRADPDSLAYIESRVGFVARALAAPPGPGGHGDRLSTWSGLSIRIRSSLARLLPDAYRVGRFRMGGEIHQWMYDRYSLAELLADVGFQRPSVRAPQDSAIPGWATYHLDVDASGRPYDPCSLFMEAEKARDTGTA